jgi:hypothetical protein
MCGEHMASMLDDILRLSFPKRGSVRHLVDAHGLLGERRQLEACPGKQVVETAPMQPESAPIHTQ